MIPAAKLRFPCFSRQGGEMQARPELRTKGKSAWCSANNVTINLSSTVLLITEYTTQGLKAVDGTIKKESDLPAADPNTPIPLKYEDRSEIGACAAETGISRLLERG